MLTFEIRDEEKLVILEPHGPLSSEDFDRLSQDLDRWLMQNDELWGVLIRVKRFPGWEDLTGLMSHVDFVRRHHQRIQRVALVSDSTVAALAPKLVDLFIHSEIETFGYDQEGRAMEWLRSES